jgi:hypothetical protein
MLTHDQVSALRDGKADVALMCGDSDIDGHASPLAPSRTGLKTRTFTTESNARSPPREPSLPLVLLFSTLGEPAHA